MSVVNCSAVINSPNTSLICHVLANVYTRMSKLLLTHACLHLFPVTCDKSVDAYVSAAC